MPGCQRLQQGSFQARSAIAQLEEDTNSLPACQCGNHACGVPSAGSSRRRCYRKRPQELACFGGAGAKVFDQLHASCFRVRQQDPLRNNTPPNCYSKADCSMPIPPTPTPPPPPNSTPPHPPPPHPPHPAAQPSTQDEASGSGCAMFSACQFDGSVALVSKDLRLVRIPEH